MTWILNLRVDEAILISSAFWIWSARVVFPEEGRPENITSGIRLLKYGWRCRWEEMKDDLRKWSSPENLLTNAIVRGSCTASRRSDEMVDSRDDSDSEEQIDLFPDPEGYYKPRRQPTSISFTRKFASAPYPSLVKFRANFKVRQLWICDL